MSSPSPPDALHGLLATFVAPETPDPVIAARAISDDELGEVTDTSLPVALVNTGGAGQLAGPLGLARRRELAVASLTTTVADLSDPAGNVRRIVAAVEAARDECVLDGDVTVRVGLPAEPVGHAWEAAADEVAAVEFEAALSFDRAGTPVPGEVLVGWIDALLDRETGFAVLGVDSAPAVLGVLGATAAAWDGQGTDAAVSALPATPTDTAITTGRRWCRSFHVRDGATVAADLRQLLG